jgi:hypothetical protein
MSQQQTMLHDSVISAKYKYCNLLSFTSCRHAYTGPARAGTWPLPSTHLDLVDTPAQVLHSPAQQIVEGVGHEEHHAVDLGGPL